MTTKKNLYLFVCLFSFFSLCDAKSSLKLEVSAKAAILLNAETGAILYEKNAHQPMFPASVTKMITAMYALEKKSHALNELVTASSESIAAVHPHIKRSSTNKHPPYRLEYGGSHIGIKAGEALPLGALLYGLMLASGNDAANVIAQYVSGSVSQFVQELNDYVKSKGCLKTVLCNPHGLPYDEHKTTAYDLAILTKEALKYPLLREIAKTVKYTRPASNMQPESFLHQHNALVKPGGKFYYPKAIGIKTGYTSAAGYTLIAAAEDSHRKLIVVLLGCEQLEQRYKDAIVLFEAAFKEEKATRILFSSDFDFFSSQIKEGKNVLKAGLSSDLVVEYYPSEGQVFHSKIFWESKSLPIRKEEKVGEVHILSEYDQIVATSPLFALYDVEPTLGYRIQRQWIACKRLFVVYHAFLLALIGCGILGGAFLFYTQRKRKSVKN